jgi:hypothetical protein
MRGFDKPGSAGAPGGAGGRGRRTGLPAGGPVSSGWLRTVGAGLALGAGWGVLVRVYMRLVSTAPSFSWSGTLFIIGVAALAGAALGVVQAARVRRARRWWRAAALGALPLFAGPGMLLLPALVVGGWAWSGRGPVLLRVVAVLPLLAVPLEVWQGLEPIDRLLLSPVTVFGGFWLLSLTLAAAGAVVFRPWPQRVLREEPVGAFMA